MPTIIKFQVSPGTDLEPTNQAIHQIEDLCLQKKEEGFYVLVDDTPTLLQDGDLLKSRALPLLKASISEESPPPPTEEDFWKSDWASYSNAYSEPLNQIQDPLYFLNAHTKESNHPIKTELSLTAPDNYFNNQGWE